MHSCALDWQAEVDIGGILRVQNACTPSVTGHGVSPWEMTVLSFLSCPYVHLLCAPSVTHTLPRIRLLWSTECMAVEISQTNRWLECFNLWLECFNLRLQLAGVLKQSLCKRASPVRVRVLARASHVRVLARASEPCTCACASERALCVCLC